MRNNEKGFTVIEALLSLCFGILLVWIMIQVFLIGVDKKDYLKNDGAVIRFEQSVVKWIEKDYREHEVKEIKVEGTLNKKLVMITDSGNIEYKNRNNGFYREENKKSMLLTTKEIKDIEYDGNKEIIIVYDIDGYDKKIRIQIWK